MVSYFVHCDTLLQNATDIITKYDKSLLKNASDFSYKMRQLLKNVMFIVKYVSIISYL